MKRAVALETMLVALLCNLNCVVSNSTGIDQNIITSRKTGANVSSKMEVLEDDYNNGNSNLEPSIDINDDVVKEELENYKKDFVSSSVENSEELKNIINNDTPVILTLSESSTIELEKIVDAPLISTLSVNDKTLPTNNSGQDTKNAKDIKTDITPFSTDSIPQNKTEPIISNMNNNISGEQTEEIPSFSEWAQKRLEEVEKNEINSSLKGQNVNGKGTTAKLRWKNYASLDCGAKVIAANPESVSPGAVLSPSSDEYKLNTCTSRIWFVVELCEAIQTKRIDLANYELFSSSPKDFVVSVSDRYPTRDWSVVGKFTAKDERDIQSFDLDTNIFGKYIKVDIKSHYGSEHYCPISLFRAYGTSVFEVLQKEDPGNINPTEDDDDDDDDHIINLNEEHDESQKNLFSSATDAVMSIVKRAAEVLGNKVNNSTAQEKNRISNSSSSMDLCTTPSHMILCKNCSDVLFEQIYEIISCKSAYVKKLVDIPLIHKALNSSWICHSFVYEIDILNTTKYKYINSFVDYIISFFPFKYIIAMCHETTIIENKGILNISQQFSNGTGNITTEQIINLKIQEPHIGNSEHSTKLDLNITQLPNLSNLSSIDADSTISNFNENTYVSQIKPTKTLTSEVQISRTDAFLNDSNTLDLILSSENTVSQESIESASTENFIENIDNTTEIEGMDTLDDHLDHFISDFNNNDNSPHVPVSVTSSTNTPQAQKESVFLRLSNRIKVLERNMSLSSQYLEELSRRYKKQVEEMQHLLEKTIVTLHEENQKKDLRNKQLEDRLDNLTAIMESLVAERHNWILSMYCLITGTLVFIGIYFFCRKSTAYRDSTRENKETLEILRRKSIDIVTHSIPIKKKRRPSDQALKIVRCSLLNSEDKHKSNNHRQRKKKKRNLTRSNSISNIKDNCYTSDNVKSEDNTTDWIERNHQVIEDIPFALEESDHTTLESYPLENELMRLNSTNNMPSTPNKNSSHNLESNNTSICHEEGYNNPQNNYLHNNVTEQPVKKDKRSFKKLFKKVF